MNSLSSMFCYFILVAHLLLGIWGLFGIFEYVTGYAFIGSLQNPNFPSGTQFIHWVLATLTSLFFLFGYFKKWKYTPEAMLVMYACLTTLCFIETFDFMTKNNRYILYTMEVVQYTIILFYLFKSKKMKNQFKRI